MLYIDKEWELKSVSLECVPFGGSHTALNTLTLTEKIINLILFLLGNNYYLIFNAYFLPFFVGFSRLRTMF